MKDQETTAEQALEEEVRRHREAYGKLEREKNTETELLHTRWVPPGLPHVPGDQDLSTEFCPLKHPHAPGHRHCCPHLIDGKTKPERGKALGPNNSANT